MRWPDRIVLFAIDPPRARYAGDARKALFEKLHDAIAAIPGVEAASLSESPLLAGGSSSTTRAGPDGRRPGPKDEAWVNDVGTKFFETMGIPIVTGRSFDAHDRKGSPPVVVVSERFVREFFPDQNPLGRTVRNSNIAFQAHGVARRTSEIGIRLALGAERRQVLLMILREALSLTAVGAGLGAAAAALLTRYVQAMLFGVKRLDPLSLAAAVTDHDGGRGAGRLVPRAPCVAPGPDGGASS